MLRHDRIHIVQGFGDTDLEFLLEVILFRGEVEAGSFSAVYPEWLLCGPPFSLRPRRGSWPSLSRSNAIIVAIAAHVAGALKHRFFDKAEDDVLSKML